MPEDPKMAAAQRIVRICDKLLTAGRDPKSIRPLVVSTHAGKRPPGRKAKGKKRKKPEPVTELPVPSPPRWEPMSGPGGIMGCMGTPLRDEQWETLWRELEKLAEEVARLVPILDPEYRIDFYSDLRPRSLAQAVPELLPPRGGSRREERRRHIRRIWEERAKKGECPGCGEPLPTDLPPGQLLCHRGENCPPGKTDDEVIERLVAQWEDLDSRNLRIQYTQPQWPGRVMDIMGHRWFFFDPLLLHRFDERIKRLRFFARQLVEGSETSARDNGLEPPNLLWWQGQPYELPQKVWKLLDFMWDREKATVNEVIEHVWPELWQHGESPEDGAIRGLLYRANKKLSGLKLDPPLPFTRIYKDGAFIVKKTPPT